MVVFGFIVYKKGGIPFLVNKVASVFSQTELNTEYTPYYKSRVSLFSENGLTEGGIVFIGDSLIDNNEWSEAFKVQVFNRGIGGDGTTGMTERLSQITESHPSKMFVMVGINDFATGMPRDKILGNYKRMIETIKKQSPETLLYIHSILPVNKDLSIFNIDNEDVNWINEKLQELAEKESINFVDLTILFVENQQLSKEYSYDGIHLNGKAYELWEDTLKKYVE